MPIYTYTSFEEAEKALWNFNPDKAYYKKISHLFEVAFSLSPHKCEPGIQKFKSIYSTTAIDAPNPVISSLK